MTRYTLVCILVAALGLSACANVQNKNTKLGTVIGAVAGGVIGKQLGDESDTNVAIGAVLGAVAGGAVGHYMDEQAEALEQKLSEEAAANKLYIKPIGAHGVRVGIAGDYSFAVDSANLSFQAKKTYTKIANVFKNYPNTIIHVVGFTDSTGAASYNMKLSKRRASSVASYLANQGIKVKRIQTWGRGENQPIAPNSTKAGRARNRRVEIVVKPIIEGKKRQAFTAPPYLGDASLR